MGNPELVLIGGGGHCRACIDVIETHGGWTIAGILDVPDRVGARVYDYEIIGSDDAIEKLAPRGAAFLVVVGQITDPGRRVELYKRVRAAGGQLPVVVSPHAYVSPHARLGSGTIVMHHAVVNCGALVGDNVIVNTMALVEHDARIGDHCHVSTGARINGGAVVGERTFIGSNAVLHHGACVTDGSVIAAGSVYRTQG